MPTYDFDLFTLGAGSGGVAASRRAGSYGARVAISEAQRVGGTCVLRGCVPKKLLVYGAQVADALADAAGYGWSIPEATHDWARLVEAKDRELDRLSGVYRRLLADAGVTVIEGHARIVDPHTVEVDGRRFTAAHILVATGGQPERPRIPGVELGLTSAEALDLPTRPERVLVVGGGYVGLEFAGIFRSLGSAVTVWLRGEHVLRGFDDDVALAVEAGLRGRGVALEPNTEPMRVERQAHGLVVMSRAGARVEVDAVLFATGRVPNTRDLGLEALGLRLDSRGAIPVDAFSRTAIPSIFAVGDCTDRVNLTPVAIAEGRAVAETLFHDRPTRVDHEGVPSAVFSQPPVATVGLSEARARQQFEALDVYVTRFRPMKHVLAGRDERMMMKLVVDRGSQRVLGVHIVGPDAPEIIQGFAVALKCGVTKAQLDATIGLHPTAAEELVTMRERRPD